MNRSRSACVTALFAATLLVIGSGQLHAGRPIDFSNVPLKKAIQRIQEVQHELVAEREANRRGAIEDSEESPAGTSKSSFAKAPATFDATPKRCSCNTATPRRERPF